MDYNRLYSTLKAIYETYQKLNEELSHITSDTTKLIELNKKIAQVEEVAIAFLKYQKFLKEQDDLLSLLNNEKDEEILTIANNELQQLKKDLIEFEKDTQILLLPKDPNEGKDLIIEIRPAAGGDESSIFVGDLFDAYKRYAIMNNWKLNVLDLSQNAIGISYLSFSLSGADAYSKMKFESGVHRVQRVPETEAKGRVHTSTITVSVMPEKDEVEIKINPVDLRVDVFRASGAGGQHVNKTESAVRITHLPTNIVVACQESKSQISNRDTAMKMLRSKLWELENARLNKEHGDIRKAQVGTGDRSEKIRTYNYPQNRVSDHRINLTLNKLDIIMLGEFKEIHQALLNDERENQLASLVENNEN